MPTPKNSKSPPKPRGRPLTYTPTVGAAICAHLAEGKSLRSICEADEFPSESTVRGWALDDVQGFAAQYARAREIGYERMAEEIVDIADETSNDTIMVGSDDNAREAANTEWISRSKLRVDARKWILSKMLPKKYGEKLQTELSGALETKVTGEVAVRPQLTREEWLKLHLGPGV